MTIETTTSRIAYTAAAGQTTFPYTFRVLANTDLRVFVNDILKTLTTDYTVTGVGVSTGGNVVFTVARAANEAIVIRRTVDQTQSVDLVEAAALPPEDIEEQMDRAIMAIQEHDEEIGRSLKFSESSAQTGINVPDLDAQKFLRVNATGTALEWVDVNTLLPTSVVSTVSALWQTILAETTRAASKTLLHIPRRSTILNGGFRTFQRYPYGLSAVPTNTYVADRFRYDKSGAAVISITRGSAAAVGEVPTVDASDEFRPSHSMIIEVTTADAAIAATDFYTITYTVEGHDYAKCHGVACTATFFMKAPVAGRYYISISNGGNARYYSTGFDIVTANAWQKVTINIPANTLGTWTLDESVGASISLWLAAGSNYHGSTDLWTSAARKVGADIVNGMSVLNGKFMITGVRFEPSAYGSEFYDIPISEERLLLKRYYRKTNSYSVTPGTLSDLAGRLITSAASTGSWGLTWSFDADMRVAPTIYVADPVNGTNNPYNETDAAGTTFAAGYPQIGTGGVNFAATHATDADNAIVFQAFADADYY